MTGVDRQRRQDREDPGAEHGLQDARLALVQLRPTQDVDPFGGEQRRQLPVQPGLPSGDDLGPLTDLGQLLGGCQPIGRARSAEPGHLLSLQTGDADLEELIQVAGGDGQELHPFEERDVGVLAKRQHPLVEGKPAQLAVQIALIRWQECAVGTARPPHWNRLARG